MSRSVLLAAILLLLPLDGSSWATEPRSANPKQGQVLYERHCLRCHGEKLDGRGPEAKFLTVPPADLSSLSSRVKSDFELLITIAHGVLFTPMHGFRETLNEENIRDVLAFIRMEAPFKPLALRSRSDGMTLVMRADTVVSGKERNHLSDKDVPK